MRTFLFSRQVGSSPPPKRIPLGLFAFACTKRQFALDTQERHSHRNALPSHFLIPFPTVYQRMQPCFGSSSIIFLSRLSDQVGDCCRVETAGASKRQSAHAGERGKSFAFTSTSDTNNGKSPPIEPHTTFLSSSFPGRGATHSPPPDNWAQNKARGKYVYDRTFPLLLTYFPFA